MNECIYHRYHKHFFKPMNWIDIWTVLACLVGMVLHIFGIYYLQRFSLNGRNTYILFVNLSICDICFSFQNLLWITGEHVHCNRFLVYVTILRFAINITFYPNMFFLATERLLRVYFKETYERSWFARWKSGFCIIAWVISILFFLSLSIFAAHQQIQVATLTHLGDQILLGCNVFMIDMMVIYGYIFRKIRNDREDEQYENVQQNRRSNDAIIPLLVLITFVAFIAIPDIVVAFDKEMLSYARFFWRCNVICDALVYILLRKDAKRRSHFFLKTRPAVQRDIAMVEFKNTPIQG